MTTDHIQQIKLLVKSGKMARIENGHRYQIVKGSPIKSGYEYLIEVKDTEGNTITIRTTTALKSFEGLQPDLFNN